MGVHKKVHRRRRFVKCRSKNRFKKYGTSLIDRIIDKIPFELHVPKYQYCGPGTHLEKRLIRGDPGINPLDAACKVHDIAYTDKSSEQRSKADKLLQKEALKRVLSKDARFGERVVALGVAAAMKLKRKMSGKGLTKKMRAKKKKQISFASLIRDAKTAIRTSRPDTINSAIKVAVASVKNNKKGKTVREPRTIKLPSITGGILPLIPIFAGLGSIIGSSAGIANAINQARKGQRDLEESKRHNQAMEAIALGNKSGRGYFLHQNKMGRGYYLTQHSKNH